MRQSSVLLQFAEPIRSHTIGEFHRIQLSRSMAGDGEADFYQPEIYQRKRTVEPVMCPRCFRELDRLSQNLATCRNSRCEISGRKIVVGPLRGVIHVMVFDEFVVERTQETVKVPDPAGRILTLSEVMNNRSLLKKVPPSRYVDSTRIIEWVNACVIVLDRRYSEKTLAAIYRTAGELCDQMQWRLAK